MIVDVRVPKWGLTMEEAEVVTWYKEPDDAVEEGEPVAELETDKVTGDVESPAAGILVEILAQPGDTVEVEGLLARIDTGGDR